MDVPDLMLVFAVSCIIIGILLILTAQLIDAEPDDVARPPRQRGASSAKRALARRPIAEAVPAPLARYPNARQASARMLVPGGVLDTPRPPER